MSTTEQTTHTDSGRQLAGLDPIHSSIGFAVKHSGVMTFRGTFGEFDAQLVDGRLAGTAKVASVIVDDPNLAGHLQTPDFFDAEQYPELRFVSHSIEREGERVSIAGDLTLKRRRAPGRDRRHVLRADHGRLRKRADRARPRDHDQPPRLRVSWNADLPGGGSMLDDDVVITANLALVQA